MVLDIFPRSLLHRIYCLFMVEFSLLPLFYSKLKVRLLRHLEMMEFKRGDPRVLTQSKRLDPHSFVSNGLMEHLVLRFRVNFQLTSICTLFIF